MWIIRTKLAHFFSGRTEQVFDCLTSRQLVGNFKQGVCIMWDKLSLISDKHTSCHHGTKL